MRAAVDRDGRALQYAAAELRADRDLMLAAITNDQGYLSFQYAAAELRADRGFAIEVAELSWTNLQVASSALRGDRMWC